MDEWLTGIKQRELEEKRKIAPGYLDTGVVMLEPVKKGATTDGGGGGGGVNLMDDEQEGKVDKGKGRTDGGAEEKGEELDRAFGGLGV